MHEKAEENNGLHKNIPRTWSNFEVNYGWDPCKVPCTGNEMKGVDIKWDRVY